MAVYVDHVLAVKQTGASLNAPVTMTSGAHIITVKSWDTSGATQVTPIINVTVSGKPNPPSPSGGTTISNIDQMTGWQDCGACAGRGGNGPVVPYSMTQNVSSPSVDGKAAQFWIGGSTPYASALWWKQLGAQPTATHFTYDLSFYLTDANASQALEFDINQSVNGRKFIFGTECNFSGSKQWDIWDSVKHWIPSGVACPRVASNTWHHLTIEVERAGNQTHFIAITVDGAKHYVNRYQASQASGVSEMNVAVQLDSNSTSTHYSMWTDKISLTYE
jgi:hypothetical protein